MKKLAVAIAAALVLALAVPAAAAVNFTGTLKTEVTADQQNNWKLQGKTGLDLDAEFAAGGGQNIKAVIELSPWSLDQINDDGDPLVDMPNDFNPIDTSAFSIDKAYLQTEGAFWNGGPSVLTTAGDVEVNWNDAVGAVDEQRGVTVENMAMGPITGSAFYAFNNGAENPMGASVKANIVDGVDLGATTVRRGDGAGFDTALSAASQLVDGVSMDGTMAIDANKKQAYKVNAKIDALDNMAITASYRKADTGFSPMYDKTVDEIDDIHGDEQNGVLAWYNENVAGGYDLNGFRVGAETTQSGVQLSGVYDQPTRMAHLAAATEMSGVYVNAATNLTAGSVVKTVLGAEKSFDIQGMKIAGAYEATLKPATPVAHKITAETTTSMIPQLQGLALNGELDLNGSQLDNWNVGADYSAPNGVSVSAEYDHTDGASVSTGLEVSF